MLRRCRTAATLAATTLTAFVIMGTHLPSLAYDTISGLGRLELAFDAENVLQDQEKYLDSVRAPNGLVRSFTDTSSLVFAGDTGRFYTVSRGKIGYLEDQAFTYDLSLAVIGFILLDQKKNAEDILDLLEEDFYLEKNGNPGLYNSYRLSSKVPFDNLNLGADGDRMHTGPMLWVALAALNHIKIYKTTRYLNFTLDMVNWCRESLAYYTFPDGSKGGISMGFGWGPDWSKIFSTEHNIDYYSVLQMLERLYEQSPDEVRRIFKDKNIDTAWLKEEMAGTGRFLREVAFNKDKYCFRAGVNPYGIDDTKILDGTTWGIGGVGPENYAEWGIDPDRLIESTERIFCASYPMPDGNPVTGFDITDFDGTGQARNALVWFEGTGQLIIAYGEMARYHEKRGNRDKVDLYRRKAAQCINDMYRFSYNFKMQGALPYMAVRPAERNILKTMKWEWEIPRGRDGGWVKSMSSTMWFLYALKNLYNPMRWGEAL